MKRQSDVRKVAIRYSEAFKMAVVRELEEGGIPYARLKEKYGIRGGGTLQTWARKYGKGDIGKMLRVERPKEIKQRDEMKQRIKALERALADAHIDLGVERACIRVACERAGIEDIDEFKKKVRGK